MPADSLVHVRGLDARETTIEAAAVLSMAIQGPDLHHGLGSVYLPSKIDEILGFFSLAMPSILDGSFDAPPDYVLGECLKVLEASDMRDVPLATALTSLNLYSLGRFRPVADVAVKALWHKMWHPVAQFLRATATSAQGGRGEGRSPKPPVMELPDEDPFSWNPHDAILLGDYTMWARGIGPMFHSLAGWNSTWAMPPRPKINPDAGPSDHGDHTSQIAYWSGLAQLVLGPMGWTDPALGTARWVLRGMPTTEPALQFLADVWGSDALMFFCTSRDWVPMTKENEIFAAGARGAERFYSSLPRKQQIIGYGQYHLCQHLAWQMCGGGPADLAERETSGELFGSRTLGDDEQFLMLRRFAGWYRQLELHGRPFSDGSRIHVVAPPVGYMGAFKRDRQTQRWHSTSTQVHRLGN